MLSTVTGSVHRLTSSDSRLNASFSSGVSTQIGGKAMVLRAENADSTSVYAHVWKKINDALLATRAKQDEHGKSFDLGHD